MENSCRGMYPIEYGCVYELDSNYQMGECFECWRFGCDNEFNCCDCAETDCIRPFDSK